MMQSTERTRQPHGRRNLYGACKAYYTPFPARTRRQFLRVSSQHAEVYGNHNIRISLLMDD
jgi:hypothetical protein